MYGIVDTLDTKIPQQETVNRTMSPLENNSASSRDGLDKLSLQLQQEALEVARNEPELCLLLHRTVLAPGVVTFEHAVASTVCYRLLLQPCEKKGSQSDQQPTASFCPHSLQKLLRECLESDFLEQGHTMAHAIREDALAVCRRDPAMDSVLQVVLFSKGYAALVCHRAAHQLWKNLKRKFTALFLQSQASAVFGLDLHPLALIGCAVMLDHGTGIVIGETATVGDGCTLLHGVTLGGTGKDHGDRHPKVGRNCLIGAGASLLGNISIGDGAKIGAGSVVLRPIPAGATAVGAPAKIIGRASETNPGSDMDEGLTNVSLLHKSQSSAAMTASTSALSESSEDSESHGDMCPYRDYSRLSACAPDGTVNIHTLSHILKPLGCTAAEVSACLFALDTHNVGHISMEVFRKAAVGVISKYTKLNEKTLTGVLESYFAARNDQ